MAETDTHRDQMVDLIKTLQWFYRDRPDVYVSGNLLVFHEEGNRRKHRSPDVFAVLGIPKRRRKNYLIWVEGKAPDVAFEITSESTRDEDVGAKKELYASVGVREYFLFDPLGEYLKPQLMGYRLESGVYVPMIGLVLMSECLKLELRVVDGWLRLYDPATGLLLPTVEERALLAERRALAAEARERLLQAELDRLRGSQ